jgi:hypothetical protein
MNGTGSGSCTTGGVGICAVEPSGSATTVSVIYFTKRVSMKQCHIKISLFFFFFKYASGFHSSRLSALSFSQALYCAITVWSLRQKE